MIGDDMQKLKKLSHMNSLQYTLTSLSTGGASAIEIDKLKERELNHSINPQLVVEKKSTDEIWNEPPRDPTHPIHLIIVTHGIFSNLTADLLYVRDTLMNNSSENVLIRGYAGNAGKTERGVKKLGKNMGKYLIEYIEHECPYKIEKISFLGHSLGGLVQLYAIRYILLTKGITWFNDHKIQPQNLIFLASPLLGILNEISFFLSWFLDLGTLGKTGRDLTLSKRFLSLKSKRETSDDMSLKPILEILPDSPLQEFLGKFKKLTIYANAVNDGIVPLRTAALLYLDYEALGDVNEIKKHHPVNTHSSSSNASIQTNTSTNTITEVPEDDDTNGEGEGKKLKNQSVNKIRAIGDILNLNLGWKPSHSSTASRKLTSRERKFLRISAKGIDSDSIRQYENDDDYEEDDIGNTTIVSDGTASTTTNTEPALNIPPRANVVESALNAIICPVPSTNFIMNPESRNAVIFHDKYYKFENLPKPENEKDEEHKFLFTWTLKHDWKLKKQVRIARKYHTGELNWRKILVHLPPDAHNNIIVRRRFANGYGWGVIDHVCENLFMSDRLSQNGHGKLHDKPQDNEVVKAKM
ncbi:putative serine esterase-domain-containing protein [Scheffersomyces amazonensis]|uniref:putative serine esterase-domain-containing protein n=1 Tax=Scheffersomyces amazonensis TaxID=1078765 RepID=UPI00315DC415